ncbi:MAG: DUF3256 family protein [Bacteroidaceae bacterium]|nr:DUF3256 family protein [Bacteroidaceae bacterium]
MKLTILFATFMLAGSVVAQNMRTLFLNAPDSIMPLLTYNNRADCIDFIDAGMRARVTNRLDGYSELLSISDDYMELRSTDSSTMQMKLLPLGNDTVVAVVRTVCAEACDSRLTFYNRDWTMAASPAFVRPAVEEFFVATDSLPSLLARCDIYLVQLRLSTADNSLRAEYTMPHYMSEEDSALVAPKLQPIVYRWQGGAFVKE